MTPERLPGWVERFQRRHGTVAVRPDDHHTVLCAPDGAAAAVALPTGETAPDVPSLLRLAADFRDFGLLLVRRGGYAVGVVEGAQLRVSRCGRRYVQGRSKAGGWSQQRYARRREAQGDRLVREAADAVASVFVGQIRLVCGGDRLMVRRCLEESRLDDVTQRVLPRWLSVPDPRHAVLLRAVDMAREAWIELNPLA